MTQQLTNLTPTAAIDVVGIFDINFNQLFADGSPIKATIKDEATFFKHPLESSAVRTDHIIFNPVQIQLAVMLTGEEYRNVYQQIKTAYRGQTQLIVQTKTDTYENMYIQSIPHDEDPDLFDAVIMALTLQETQISVSRFDFIPESLANRDTVNRGQQDSEDATESQEDRGTLALRLAEGLGEQIEGLF